MRSSCILIAEMGIERSDRLLCVAQQVNSRARTGAQCVWTQSPSEARWGQEAQASVVLSSLPDPSPASQSSSLPEAEHHCFQGDKSLLLQVCALKYAGWLPFSVFTQDFSRTLFFCTCPPGHQSGSLATSWLRLGACF